MGPRRRKSKNVVNKCILRQVRESSGCSAQFPRSSFQPWLDITSHCISLSSIQTNNSFAEGHVLLCFTKCGEYLLSYKELQGDLVGYKYTLYWWKFNMRRPLQQVCNISLFVGEVISEQLLLVVCHTLNDNRILVHGSTRYSGIGEAGIDEQCQQCYITICPSPPGTTSTSYDDTWVVHMKYNLLPPFPLFEAPSQLRLQDTVVLNTVDSVLAVTISPCNQHKTSEANSRPQTCEENRTSSCEKPKTECANGFVTDSEVEDLLEKPTVKSPLSTNEVEKKFSTKESEVSRNKEKNCIHETTKANEVELSCKDEHRKTECSAVSSCNEYNATTICLKPNTLTKALNDDHPIGTNLIKKNQEIDMRGTDCMECNGVDGGKLLKCEESAKEISKSSYLTSFNFKTFSIGTDYEIEESSWSNNVIDGTSYLDIKFTTVEDTPFKLIECLQDKTEMNDHSSPCIHTRVVSLDVERYISEALNTLDELKEKYWSLKNYSTLLVDVSEDNQCVIIHIVILISVQDHNEKTTKRKICSLSLLLTWNIGTGNVRTLDISSPMYTMAKTDKQILWEGRAKVADLRKRYSVPFCGAALQSYYNRSVFTGKTLEFIRHPFQPIAIVL